MAKYNDVIVSNDNVAFVHMSADRDTKAALKWAKNAKLPWLHVLPEDMTPGLKALHTERYVPFYTLVDKNGKVLANGQKDTFEKAKKLAKK